MMTSKTFVVRISDEAVEINIEFEREMLYYVTSHAPISIQTYKQTIYTTTGASFQLFLGGQIFFFIFQCHRTIEKLEKNSTFYVVI